MASNKKTLDALKRFRIAEQARHRADSEYASVVVAPRFLTWIAQRPQPGATYQPMNLHAYRGFLSFDGVDPVGMSRELKGVESFAKYPHRTMIMTTYSNGNGWVTLMRMVSQREAEEGFGVEDELGGKEVDFWKVIHWISDPDRQPHVRVYLLGSQTTAFKITAPYDIEFKIDFSLG